MPPRHRPKSKNHLPLALVLITLGMGTMLILSARAKAEIVATEKRALKADNTKPIPSARRLNVKQLEAEINELIESEPSANISVALYDFITDKTLMYGADKSYVAASVPKLLTASLWLHEVDEGRRKLSDPVGGSTAREQLRLLIEISDNTAWELLDEKLGKSAIETYAKLIGMKRYDFAKNALSAADTLVLLQKLYDKQLLKPDSQKLLMGWMERANYRQYIMAVLPDEAKGYHKVGFLEDRVLDTAIVENGRLAYALVIFSEARTGSFDLASAGGTVRDIAEAVQSRYEKE